MPRVGNPSGLKVGAITGSKRERACLAHDNTETDDNPEIDIFCSGAVSSRASMLAASLVDQGCAGLLSIGLAGGLDPALKPGDVVVSSTIIASDGTKVPSDAAWRDRVVADLDGRAIPFRIGAIAGLDELVRLAETKRALRSATGALAVDMESHAVMRIAVAADIPFLAVRVIADDAADELPRAATVALTEDGGVAIFRLLGALLRRPSDVSGMIMLGQRSASGFNTLRRIAPLAALRQPRDGAKALRGKDGTSAIRGEADLSEAGQKDRS
jgi:adenosylhomocysteine nucleosidase